MTARTFSFLLSDAAQVRAHFSQLEPICQEIEPEPEPLPLPDLSHLEISEEKTCATCGQHFDLRIDQVEHFRGDWHRYNVKAKMKSGKVLSEAEFEQLGSDCESISASESGDEQSDEEAKLEVVFDAAKLLFMNAAGCVLEVSRTLLRAKCEVLTSAELLGRLESLKNLSLALIIISGGHFAGAVYKNGHLVRHKTFHQYTVRRKQGGSQSQYDSKAGPAKSAGASLRRYNERTLMEKARAVLKSWTQDLDRCSVILYRALGYSNRAILFDGNEPVFRKDDPRLRTIPMVTRRPTLKELDRIHTALITVKVVCDPSSYYETRPVPIEMKARSEAMKTSKHDAAPKSTKRLKEPAEPAKPQRNRPTKQDASTTPKELLDEVFTACRDNDIDTIKKIAEKADAGSLSKVLVAPIDTEGQTILHFCCRRNRAPILETLLTLGGDPSVTNVKNQTPYEVAMTDNVKQVMIAFRSRNPSMYDYVKAKIPEELLVVKKQSKAKVVRQTKPSAGPRKEEGDLLKRLTDTMRSCDFCKSEFRTVPLEADGKRFCSVNCVRSWRFA